MNRFAEISAFWLLILPLIWRVILPAVKGLHGDALKIPFLSDLQKISSTQGTIKPWSGQASMQLSWRAAILWLIWVLLVIAAARPQWVGEPIKLRSESRDILLVTDISTSMLEPDFVLGRQRIDRLTAVKKTAQDFMDKRVDDRVGLILFGTNAYLQAPLTYDRKAVSEILWQTDAGMAGQSTAIGDALGLALKTLKDTVAELEKQKQEIEISHKEEIKQARLNSKGKITKETERAFKTYTSSINRIQQKIEILQEQITSALKPEHLLDIERKVTMEEEKRLKNERKQVQINEKDKKDLSKEDKKK